MYTHQVQFGVLRVVVLEHWVIASSVVSNQEGPPPSLTPVLVATMQHVGMEEQCISRFHFNLNQRQHLHGNMT